VVHRGAGAHERPPHRCRPRL